MGKVRIKTFGDEELEKKDAKKAAARAEAKKAKEAAAARQKATTSDTTVSEAEPVSAESPAEATEAPKQEVKADVEKKEVKKPAAKPRANISKHSAKYLAVVKEVDRNKKYTLSEALTLLEKLKYTKFDETVELHINTTERGVSGSFVLPHGTGKETKVVIANQSADPKHVEELVKQIEAGQINFDVLVATPNTMPKLARVAKVLGPRGLMPNPKNGTVTPKPEEVAKKFAGGQINFKTEAKFPLLHLSVGKLSFGEQKLADNIKVALQAIQPKQIKNITLKSTMSPGIKLDNANF